MANPTAEEAILTKLAQAPSFHPAGAKLFVPDWTLDPGDVVTVTAKDNVNDPDETPTSYNVPIYSLNLTWNGVNRVEIESTGNQQREPLSALRRKEYQTGRRGYGTAKQIEEQTQQQYEHYVDQTDAYRKEIYRVNGVVYDNEGNIVYQTDPITGEYILDNAGNKIPVYNPESNGSISGQVIQSAQRMATVIKQSGTVEEVFSDSKQYYEGDRVIGPDGNPYRFITDHNPGAWKGAGEHGDVEAIGTLQSQIDHNTENFNIIYGEVTNIDGRVDTIEGSTLWGNASELLAINGRIRIDNNGRLIIEEGGGLYTERTVAGTTVQSGIWDNGNLTAGAIVGKINNQSSGQGQTVYRITADKIILDGTATATTLDARLLNVDQLFSDTGYAESIRVGKSVNAKNVYAESFYLTQETGTDPYQVHTRLIYLLGDNTYLTNISALTIGSAETLNLRHSHAITITALTGNDEGKIQVQLGEAVATDSADRTKNFNIADTAFYKSHVGVNSAIMPNTPTDDQDTFTGYGTNNYNTNLKNIFLRLKVPSKAGSDYDYYIGVNATGVYNKGKNSVGLTPMSYTEIQGTNYPASQTIFNDTTGRTDANGNADNLHRDITLTLDVDDDYVYMKHGSDIIARISNTGSGSGDVYDAGYAAGQNNASAEVKGVSLNRNRTSYSSSDHALSLNIIATSKLVLLSQDDPPIPSERNGNRIEVDDTMNVAVTSATLSAGEFTNGQYTITGSGGKVNIDAVDGEGGANIPVGVNPLTFTPTAAIADGRSQGWGAAYGQVSWPTSGTSNSYIEVGAPISTVDGPQDKRKFEIRNLDNNSVVLSIKNSQNNTYTDYAKLTHNKYTAGQNSVNVTGPTWAGATATDSRKATFSPSAGTGSSAEMTLTLSAYASNFNWNDTGTNAGKYTYDVTSNVNDGSGVKLTKTTSGLTLTPTGAIDYGKTLVGIDTITLGTITSNASARTASVRTTVLLNNGVSKTDDVDVSTIYQAGLDGGPEITSAPFRARLVDNNNTFIRTAQKTINVSDIYEQGVRDATPTTVTFIYDGNGNLVNAYSTPKVIPASSDIYGQLYPNTKINYIRDVTVTSSIISRTYAECEYYGVTFYVLKTNVHTGTTPNSPSNYGTATGWYSGGSVSYDYNGVVSFDSGNSVTIYSSQSTSSTAVTTVQNEVTVQCMYNPNGYAETWMPVKYGNYTGYLESKYIYGTNAWNELHPTVPVLQSVAIDWIRHSVNSYSGDVSMLVDTTTGNITTKTSSPIPQSAYTAITTDSSADISKYLEYVYRYAYLAYTQTSGFPDTITVKMRLILTYSGTSEPTYLNIETTALGELVYQYTSTVYADSGSTVRMRASASSSGSTVTNVPIGATIYCFNNPVGYSGDWMRVKYGQYDGYMMAKFIVGTDAYEEAYGGGGEKEVVGVTVRYIYHKSPTKDFSVFYTPKNGVRERVTSVYNESTYDSLSPTTTSYARFFDELPKHYTASYSGTATHKFVINASFSDGTTESNICFVVNSSP